MYDPDRDWLLDCEPRPAQEEAIRRAYYGYKLLDHKNDDNKTPVPLPHYGKPARGFCYFMQMRVGKTPTALNEFELLQRDHGVERLFVVSPSKYKHAWGLEMIKFGTSVPNYVFETSLRKQFKKWMDTVDNGPGAVVVNYEALIQQPNLKLFEEWVTRKTMVVFDESVLVKNPNAQSFQRAMGLIKDAAYIRPMSGLPAPQGPFDYWTQLRLARKLEGVNFYAFRAKYTKMGGFKNKRAVGIKNEDGLRAVLGLSAFVARRAAWATKLDSDYEDVQIDMLPEQRAAYKEMDEEFVLWLNTSDAVSADQVITKRIKLQQISSGFIIDESKQIHDLVDFTKTPKFIDLVDRLDNYVDGKVIIIAHFTATIERLRNALSKYNPAVIAGSKHMKAWGLDTEAEKGRFNLDPACRVIIGQGQAIKYGHTLMGTPEDPCHSIAFYENSYSLDTRSQCEERPQGEGQLEPIHIWDYHSGGVEAEIIKALQFKQSLSEVILGYYGKF